MCGLYYPWICHRPADRCPSMYAPGQRGGMAAEGCPNRGSRSGVGGATCRGIGSPQMTPPAQILVRWIGVLPPLLLLSGLATPGPSAGSATDDSGREIDFGSQIYPIFERRCQECHGAAQQMGEFRLDSRAVALEGGVSGPNILPGQSDASPLFQRIAGIGDLNAMPMTGERLSTKEVDLIKSWIDLGAKWPEDVGTDAAKAGRHWAYVAPVHPSPPVVGRAEAVRNPIDNFILARLEAEGLFFAPEASKEALIRRASLDLRGLPPRIDEVDAFLADTRPDAYERLVDRMLKSPHFGEHFGGYWLDLARYADTNGYESDEPRTIWPYRDWVIDAFNRNLPFDTFTIEQLAGDLLPNATVDQIVATGFHRNTMLNNEAGSKNDEFYDAAVKDRVDTTATVWLGSTVGCAQCHDHKYDPFKQSEYYQLYAVFNNTADSATKISAEKDVFAGDKDELQRRIDEVEALQAVLDAPTRELEDSQRAWEEETVAGLDAWASAWRVFEPVEAAVVGGAELDVLPDGSILAGEPTGTAQVYELTFETGPTTVTGLRIEPVSHQGLPAGGPGWGAGGGFSLTGVEAEAWRPQAKSAREAARRSEPAWGSWHAIGPFRVSSRDEAFRTAFPPEGTVDLSATYENGHLAWLERKDWADGRIHYLGYIPDDSEANCASYAYRTVEVQEPTSVRVSMGSLKGLKVWLNSELVLAADPTRQIAPDQEDLTLELRAGTNEILLKLTNDLGPYGFYFQPYFGGEREARLRFARATTEDGKWMAADIAALVDGRSETAWKPPAGDFRATEGPQALLRLATPVAMPGGSLLKVRLIHDSPGDGKSALGRFRISATSLDVERLAALQSTPAQARRVLAIRPAQRTEPDAQRLAAHFRSIAPELNHERGRLLALKASLEDFRNNHTAKTLVMQELPEPRETRIQNRGNFLDLAERVSPGVPLVLSADRPASVTDRLELAEWLTSAENPLTARVRVNQIWNRLFGRGLVPTEEDFGSQGDRPTHPALMDWLATEFVRSGWDTQALLKTIVTSATYRQDSAATRDKIEKDPNNELLSRGARNRVAAEIVRDIALASSGLLSREVGGPSVFPPQPAEVFGDHFIEGGFKSWPTSEGRDRYRRGLYTFYKRTVTYPTFMNFDAPDRTVCTVDRSLSNTPLQALNTLNDPAFVEAAGSLARRMMSETGDNPADRITHGFRAALARRPLPEELDRLLAFHARMKERYESEPGQAAELMAKAIGQRAGPVDDERVAPWVMVANVLLNLDETFTRE